MLEIKIWHNVNNCSSIKYWWLFRLWATTKPLVSVWRRWTVVLPSCPAPLPLAESLVEVFLLLVRETTLTQVFSSASQMPQMRNGSDKPSLLSSPRSSGFLLWITNTDYLLVCRGRPFFVVGRCLNRVFKCSFLVQAQASSTQKFFDVALVCPGL